MAVTATTELEAVNNILYALNEAPVTALGSNQSVLSNRVQAVLTQVSREVQLQGWAFNLDFPVTLTESGGEIPVPADSLWVKVSSDGSNGLVVGTSFVGNEHIIERARKLFKRGTQSYAFDTGETVENVLVCRALDFADLPEVAKTLIYLKALRRISATVKPNAQRDASLRADELRAHGDLLEQEGLQDSLTIFDNYDAYQSIDRGNPGTEGPSWR